VKWFLQPYWTNPVTHRFVRGFGNKQYNCQECKDKDRAVSYAVKLGEFWYEGFTDEYIEQRGAESFEKKKPSTFKLEYIELCSKFQETDMDIKEFMVKYVELKAKFGQQVTLHHAYGYAISNMIQRDGNAELFVQEYLNKNNCNY